MTKHLITLEHFPRAHWVTIRPVPHGEQEQRAFRYSEQANDYAKQLQSKYGGEIRTPARTPTWPWDDRHHTQGKSGFFGGCDRNG